MREEIELLKDHADVLAELVGLFLEIAGRGVFQAWQSISTPAMEIFPASGISRKFMHRKNVSCRTGRAMMETGRLFRRRG